MTVYSLYDESLAPLASATYETGDTSSVTLSQQFTVSSAVDCLGVRYPVPGNETDPTAGITVLLYTTTNGAAIASQLAYADDTDRSYADSAWHWRTVEFASPVALSPGTTYMVAVWHSGGRYVYNGGFWGSGGYGEGGLANGVISAPDVAAALGGVSSGYLYYGTPPASGSFAQWQTDSYLADPLIDDGVTGVSGTAAFTAPSPSLAGSGTYTPAPIAGTAAFGAPVPVLAASGTFTPSGNTGTAAFSAPAPSLAAEGTFTPAPVTGTAAFAAPAPTLAAAGNVDEVSAWSDPVDVITPDEGTGAFTAPAPVVAASGTFTPPGVTGTAAFTAPAPDLVGTGDTTPPQFTGAADFTAPAPSLAATGGSAYPPGTAYFTAPGPQLAAEGTFTPPSTTGAADFTAPAPVLAAVGTYAPPSVNGTAAFTAPMPVLAGGDAYKDITVTGSIGPQRRAGSITTRWKGTLT